MLSYQSVMVIHRYVHSIFVCHPYNFSFLEETTCTCQHLQIVVIVEQLHNSHVEELHHISYV